MAHYPEIDPAQYAAGQTAYRRGGTLRAVIERANELEAYARTDFEEAQAGQTLERPNVENQAFSLVIGYFDSVISAIRVLGITRGRR